MDEGLIALDAAILESDDNNSEWAPSQSQEVGIASRQNFLHWAKFDIEKARLRRAKYWSYRRNLFNSTSGLMSANADPRLRSALELGVVEVPQGRRDREGHQVVLLRLARVNYSLLTPEDICRMFWFENSHFFSPALF